MIKQRKMIPYDSGPIPVNTPVFYQPLYSDGWIPAHYAGRKDGKDYVFSCGRTSHTTRSVVPVREWVKK